MCRLDACDRVGATAHAVFHSQHDYCGTVPVQPLESWPRIFRWRSRAAHRYRSAWPLRQCRRLPTAARTTESCRVRAGDSAYYPGAECGGFLAVSTRQARLRCPVRVPSLLACPPKVIPNVGFESRYPKSREKMWRWHGRGRSTGEIIAFLRKAEVRLAQGETAAQKAPLREPATGPYAPA